MTKTKNRIRRRTINVHGFANQFEMVNQLVEWCHCEVRWVEFSTKAKISGNDCQMGHFILLWNDYCNAGDLFIKEWNVNYEAEKIIEDQKRIDELMEMEIVGNHLSDQKLFDLADEIIRDHGTTKKDKFKALRKFDAAMDLEHETYTLTDIKDFCKK